MTPRSVAFCHLPLAVMAAAAAAGAVAGPAWSHRAAPWPWLISLPIIGLPHGAADFAVSRTVCRGWTLAAVWIGYLLAMAGVAGMLLVAPLLSLATFAAVSCWHFGSAHRDSAVDTAAAPTPVLGVVARGCAVLAMPLAAWPVETAQTAAALAAVVVGPRAASDLPSASAVRMAGIALAALAVLAGAVEGIVAARWPRGRQRVATELAVIASLGWFTDPLFSVGLYFLVWHAWRQMGPLAARLLGAVPESWPDLGRAIVRIHRAALPLLVPTWALIGAAWWWLAPGHTIYDLAIVSIAAYLVVTPAHELLGWMVRRMPRSSGDVQR